MIGVMRDDRGLLDLILGDGRGLIAVVGLALVLSGGFAILQSASGHLLPHDSQAIGMDAAGLTHAANKRLLGFMFHDRVSYGGTLISIGCGYLWIAGVPLALRQRWAWWGLLFSGGVGFLGFLTYLGQGYLDTWHGVATLFLFPVYVAGMWRTRLWLGKNETADRSVGDEGTAAKLGRLLLSACAVGLILAGGTIAVFGMTTVFVPSDLRFVRLGAETLARISPVLIPLIAHDRAGFGAGLCSSGCLLIFMARCAELSRSFVEIVAVMGVSGFGAAIAVHFAVGYVDLFHLLPAYTGFLLFVASSALLWAGWLRMRTIATGDRPSERDLTVR